MVWEGKRKGMMRKVQKVEETREQKEGKREKMSESVGGVYCREREIEERKRSKMVVMMMKEREK